MLVGNSDGIGLATTKRLLAAGWDIIGVSRSESPITNTAYHHWVADVSESRYTDLMTELVLIDPFDLCIYFVGIGELLDPLDMRGEARIIDVNLTGMVKTAAAVIPHMVRNGKGHFIGVSSVADELLSSEAPSYHASKAGFSNYLAGLAVALKPKGVSVINVLTIVVAGLQGVRNDHHARCCPINVRVADSGSNNIWCLWQRLRGIRTFVHIGPAVSPEICPHFIPPVCLQSYVVHWRHASFTAWGQIPIVWGSLGGNPCSVHHRRPDSDSLLISFCQRGRATSGVIFIKG